MNGWYSDPLYAQRTDLNLVENGYTDQEADGECLVQPVVVEVELVGELHDLRPGGVGVWKWSAGHFACD